MPTAADARALVERLGGAVAFYKIGLELATTGAYYELLDWLVKRGNRVFCDLKLLDIPRPCAARSPTCAAEASASSPCTATAPSWRRR